MVNILNEYTLAFFDSFLKGFDNTKIDPEEKKYANINIFTKNLQTNRYWLSI